MPPAELRIGLLLFLLGTGCTSSGGAAVGDRADLTVLRLDLGTTPETDFGMGPPADSAGGSTDGSTAPQDAALSVDLTPGPLRCGDLGCVPPLIVGKPFTATGTWSGSNTYQYACSPGSPGRDTNGCCPHTDVLGGPGPSSVEFEIVQTAGPGNPLELQVSATRIDDLGGRYATMQSGPQVTDNSFRIRPFSMSIVTPFTINGAIDATWAPPKLLLVFAGSGSGFIGSGRCNAETVTITTKWELTP